jgi:hypothetical protein
MLESGTHPNENANTRARGCCCCGERVFDDGGGERQERLIKFYFTFFVVRNVEHFLIFYLDFNLKELRQERKKN